MTLWFAYFAVHAAIVAAGAVGFSLHVRLIRVFDMGWAVWATLCAYAAVLSVREFGSAWVGLLLGSSIGMLIGALECRFLLRHAAAGFLPPDALERFRFAAALGGFLSATSLIQALGFRDQEIVPAEGETFYGVSKEALVGSLLCWSLLASCYLLRRLPVGLRLRAVLTDPRTAIIHGLDVPKLALGLGAVSGALSGAAAATFGLVYRAHYTSGMALMMLAVIPSLTVGMRRSARIIVVAIGVVVLLGFAQLSFGLAAADYLIRGATLVLLMISPMGFSPRSAREV